MKSTNSKKLLFLSILTLLLGSNVFSVQGATPDTTPPTVEMYYLYDPNIGHRFYMIAGDTDGILGGELDQNHIKIFEIIDGVEILYVEGNLAYLGDTQGFLYIVTEYPYNGKDLWSGQIYFNHEFAPEKIHGEYRIEFTYINDAGLSSSISGDSFFLDSHPPVISLNGADGTNINPGVISVYVEDDSNLHSVTAKRNGIPITIGSDSNSDPTIFDGVIEVPSTIGTYTYEVSALDTIGNGISTETITVSIIEAELLEIIDYDENCGIGSERFGVSINYSFSKLTTIYMALEEMTDLDGDGILNERYSPITEVQLNGQGSIDLINKIMFAEEGEKSGTQIGTHYRWHIWTDTGFEETIDDISLYHWSTWNSLKSKSGYWECNLRYDDILANIGTNNYTIYAQMKHWNANT